MTAPNILQSTISRRYFITSAALGIAARGQILALDLELAPDYPVAVWSRSLVDRDLLFLAW